MNSKAKIKYALVGFGGALAIMVSVAATTTDFRMGRGMEILVNMFRDLTLYYVDEPDPDKLLEDAAAGMVRGLDPYTEYISPEEMARFEQMTTGKYGGVGSVITPEDDLIRFAEPYKDSPADKAGIQIGDLLLEIDGKSIAGMPSNEVSSRLRGEPGTTVRLKVRKFYTGKTESLRIKREIISVPGVPFWGMVDDRTGYIMHSDFTQGCSDDMRNAIMELKARGAQSLILDYRGNTGGILQEAVRIVSFFVPKGTEVVSMRGRNEETSATFVTQHEPIDTQMPLAVLTGPDSASAAEIVTGALQDLDRAVLIGRRTYGKGLVQSTKPLGYNSYLKLTTAKYYLPSGRCIQAIDYARRGEDGSLSYIPDSLINEFTTVAGRKVYDGGGVMPDSIVNPAHASRFAYVLFSKGYISDFVDGYMLRNRDMELSPGRFSLPEGEYEAFVAFMADKDIEWESYTKAALRVLRERARQELYLDTVGDQITALEQSLADDRNTGLQLYRREITAIIENDIILRRAYSAGVSEHNFRRDETVQAATGILHDEAAYRGILSSKDTQRE